MHHVVVERWSRGSPLHSRDARAKLGALIAFLVPFPQRRLARKSLSPLTPRSWTGAMAASRLPAAGLARRAGLILPFSATFALITWWSGDPGRALALSEKSFLSGLAALLLIATTPLTQILAALDSLGLPRLLILVVQFLYRYLFVISEQAQHMRLAARSRHGTLGSNGEVQAAAGALASSSPAPGSVRRIYRAMLARGFAAASHPSNGPTSIPPTLCCWAA